MVIHNRSFAATTLLSLLAISLDCQSMMFVRGEQKMKGNCSYVITIETSCIKDAGTSNHISLRFGNSKSNSLFVHPLNRRHVDGPCVDTAICYLYLKLTGTDSWRPGFAQVRVLDEARFNSGYFYFRRDLPRHVWHGYDLCDREVTPFGIRHKRKVFD
uniref:Uncharacterized protein n=1 Tax=Chenopodium quinoa TaxID=63459 RepID=A0A803KS55_CHEQI